MMPERYVEDRLRTTEERLTRLIDEKLKPKEEKETYVEIEEPVRDKEGNVILGPDDRPIVKKLKVPASQAGFFAKPEEDVEEKVLKKLQLYREIIRQELPKVPEKPPAPEVKPEDVERIAAEAAAKAARGAVEEFVEKHEQEDIAERRHKELLSAIQARASAKAVEGYKEDAYRVVGQGLSELASTIKERKPVEVIVKEGVPLILGTAPPKQIEKGAEEAEKGLIGLFEKRGWIAEG
jgi:hypothetical protein